MQLTFFITAFSIGLAGSMHCVGMCGPIVMGLPFVRNDSNQSKALVWLYFGGKTITYVLLGMLFGLLGQQFVMAGFQQTLSVVLGAALLVYAILLYAKPSIFHNNRLTATLSAFLGPQMGKYMRMQTPASYFVLGMLNGLLPCGLLYGALGAATAIGHVGQSALFMLVFGIASTPGLVFLALFSKKLSVEFRSALRKWLPAVTAVVAVLLILRGLDLGIPYLSPNMSGASVAPATGDPVICH